MKINISALNQETPIHTFERRDQDFAKYMLCRELEKIIKPQSPEKYQEIIQNVKEKAIKNFGDNLIIYSYGFIEYPDDPFFIMAARCSACQSFLFIKNDKVIDIKDYAFLCCGEWEVHYNEEEGGYCI